MDTKTRPVYMLSTRDPLQTYRHIQTDTHVVTLFSIKEAKIYNGEKTVSSISGAGKTGQLHEKE